MSRPPPPPPQPRPGCLRQLGCLLGGLAIVLILLLLGAIAFGLVVDREAPGFFTLDRSTVVSRLDAVRAVAIAEVGEDPHFAPLPPSGDLPLCDDVPDAYDNAFSLGFGYMRATKEGARLYDVLIDNGICVTVGDLPYNTAYAAARSVRGDWSTSKIVVDRRYVRSLRADVLAAILVHESTHLDRAISGEACYLQRDESGKNSCTILANGVTIDEEIAAHGAEARWWLAAYGDNGKRFAMSSDYSENQLAKAYLQGNQFFRDYVTRIRSDTREGEGF